jgi:4-methyl-5(b-hydroxyethyl)-thiazole monophosphate biosynthesis
MKNIQALIIMHPGFEEMEAIAPIDLLLRAGIDVTLAGTTEEALVAGRGGIAIQTSESFESVKTQEPYDVVIVPGGPGVKALRHNTEISDATARRRSPSRALHGPSVHPGGTAEA